MRSLHLLLAISLLPLLSLGGGCGDEGDNTLFIACVRNNACGVLAYPNISNCVDNYKNNNSRDGVVPLMDGIFECVASASTCAAVKACYGVGASCDRTTYLASCAGGKAKTCDLVEHQVYSYDCAGAGITCKLGTGNNAWHATCEGPKTSPTMATSMECGGDLCSPTGESCDGNTYDSCSGGKLKSCLDKEWVLFDCKALGLGDCYTSSSNSTSSCGLPK